jgi:hypothetical protein
MATEDIIDRIKKLLRLGADARGNAHEAERAMALAFALAEKHRVDVASLDLDEETARLVHEFWNVGGRYDRLRRGIFGILRSHFHVSTCLSKPRILVTGRAQDIAIAHYVHDFLLRTGRDCLRKFEAEVKAGGRRITTTKRLSFTTGFLYGLHAALQKTRETMPLTDSQSALVVVEEQAREAKINELFPQTSKLKALPAARRNRTALMAGFADGMSTTIHQPIDGATGGVLLLE